MRYSDEGEAQQRGRYCIDRDTTAKVQRRGKYSDKGNIATRKRHSDKGGTASNGYNDKGIATRERQGKRKVQEEEAQ